MLCADNETCVSKNFVCDGFARDCPDNSDELNCSAGWLNVLKDF